MFLALFSIMPTASGGALASGFCWSLVFGSLADALRRSLATPSTF
jgi:hypothetical protein